LSHTEQILQRIREKTLHKVDDTPRPDESGRLKLEDIIALYELVGHRDSDYLDWLHRVYTSMSLPCIPSEHKKMLGEDKTKLAIFDIMADDLADNFITRSRFLLQDFIRIPWRNTVENHDYIQVGQAIWDDYIESVQNYPRYKELEGIFYFDLRQVLSSMEYSSLINTIGLDNPFEMSHHSPYGCAVILALDMDLMCLPTFDLRELRTMRSISYLAQKIAHIANMLGTYPREVLEKDMSSPIISLAVRKGIITKDELGDRAVIQKLKQLEWIFRSKALSYVQKVATYEKEIRSVNIRGFSQMLDDLVERWGASPEASIPLRP
jgi:hypothetical protein